MSRPVTGVRTELRWGSLTATVGQLGAVLRGFTADGIALAESWADDVVTPMGCGLVLVPWPNRVRGGQWTLNGKVQQLDLTDPPHRGAIHGLLRNAVYEIASATASSVRLQASIYPQHGYPFTLDTAVTYALDADGLSVTHEVTNLSAAAAPVGIGAHPYLRVGTTPVDELILTVPAATEILVDEQLAPTGQRPVSGDTDLRAGATVGEVDLNVCLTDLTADQGLIRHRLTDSSGHGVQLWAEESFGFVQVFNPPNFPDPAGPRRAVAIEPMTCGVDAFNTGAGLCWVEPGQTWTVRWGLRPLRG